MALTPAPAGGFVRYAGTLRERPRWVGRFALLALVYVALGIAGAGYRADLAAEHLPPAVSAVDRANAAQSLLGPTLVRSLFLPVRLFAGWSVFALVLLYACRIWSARGELRFVHVLAAEVYAEGAMLVGSAASLAAAVTSAGPGAGLPMPWTPGGLDLLVPAEDFTARYLLNSINMFSAAYVTILAITVSVMMGLSRLKGFVSVLLAWGSSVFVNAVIFELLRTEFRLGLW